MVMSVCASGMGDAARERLPHLWRRIEDAHYSFLETDDSPEKLQQKKKLEEYIIEYLSLVPHECKFGLAESGKVFQRTINELSEFSAYRAGLGWAALARYANNLLAQPWRKEYKVIRLYCGYFKHEVEANMVGAESLLMAMGYRATRAGHLTLDAPACPDTVAAVSRDALIAHCECQIMSQIWESVWGQGVRVSWAEIAQERATRASSAGAAAARLLAPHDPRTSLLYDEGSEIYSNVPVTVTEGYHRNRLIDSRYNSCALPQRNMYHEETHFEDPITPVVHPSYMMPPQMMYPPTHQHMHPEVPVSNQVIMSPFGVPYYYPVQAPYMIPTPVYAPIKHATNVPLNGYPPITQYNRYPSVPTGQLIELDSHSTYENGKFERHRDDDRNHRKSRQLESSRRNSTSRSGFSEVSLPSLPRSDTQPTLSKAKEDGMGTYESWDYVFRNLSSKNQDPESRNRYSPSLDRDSRTLDRLDREERRVKYQPATLDLEDGLQALNMDRSYDEDAYRTAKINENLMRMKQEQELKRAKQLAKKHSEERRTRKLEPIVNPKSDALIPTKVAPDKVKLLTKKDIKDRKDVIKQQNSINGSGSSADLKKVKKLPKPLTIDVERATKSKPHENGVHSNAHSSKTNSATPSSYDLKAQLVVSLDEPDSRVSPITNGDGWECGTCTYVNVASVGACEMCGKSKARGPEAKPLAAGGRECPACTLVNSRDAQVCEACATSLDHCPTYI